MDTVKRAWLDEHTTWVNARIGKSKVPGRVRIQAGVHVTHDPRAKHLHVELIGHPKDAELLVNMLTEVGLLTCDTMYGGGLSTIIDVDPQDTEQVKKARGVLTAFKLGWNGEWHEAGNLPSKNAKVNDQCDTYWSF